MRRRVSVAAVALVFVAVPTTAQAHEPYGGCDEAWLYPTTAGADHCRRHGWVIPTPYTQRWTDWWPWWSWFR
jgi:hypothetical protein